MAHGTHIRSLPSPILRLRHTASSPHIAYLPQYALRGFGLDRWRLSIFESRYARAIGRVEECLWRIRRDVRQASGVDRELVVLNFKFNSNGLTGYEEDNEISLKTEYRSQDD